MIICVVGKSGSGKSYVCKLLEGFSQNILHVDVDSIAHKILKEPEVIKKLYLTYGDTVVEHNTVNRKKLSNIVFNSDFEMDRLTEITWPPMEMCIDDIIKHNNDKIIVLDWQNLLKTKYYYMADLNILVQAPYEERIKKVVKRDNISENDFFTREKASYNFDNAKFDYIINNDYSEKIKSIVREIYVKSIISR